MKTDKTVTQDCFSWFRPFLSTFVSQKYPHHQVASSGIGGMKDQNCATSEGRPVAFRRMETLQRRDGQQSDTQALEYDRLAKDLPSQETGSSQECLPIERHQKEWTSGVEGCSGTQDTQDAHTRCK